VKKAGGTVVIQDPATASFRSMPASLAPSTVDIVADIERIGPVLDGLLKKTYLPAHDQDGLAKLLDEVKERSGIDFHNFSPSTIQQRLQRRIADTGTTDLEGYLRYVQGHPEEHQRLINGFIVQVTEFMRDPELFVHIREKILPELITRARKRGNELRIWAAGAGTGEEAYSLAILVSEALGSAIEHFTVRLRLQDAAGQEPKRTAGEEGGTQGDGGQEKDGHRGAVSGRMARCLSSSSPWAAPPGQTLQSRRRSRSASRRPPGRAPRRSCSGRRIWRCPTTLPRTRSARPKRSGWSPWCAAPMA
jgi:hypothetical protein